MMLSIDINNKILQQAAYQQKKKSLLYGIYDGVTRRDPVGIVGIRSVGSAGQAGFTCQTFARRVTKRLCVFCT